LSYDEKPLMLFQKLKESGQKPVFMLRHIVGPFPLWDLSRYPIIPVLSDSQRDIRSPIAVAQQKQVVKLGLPPNSTVNVLPKIKPTTDTTTSPTKANSLQPGAGIGAGAGSGREDGQTPNGGAFPELPSPGLREGEGGPRSAVAGTGTLIDKEGNVREVTYAVAIYP
jgi:hypothetical protein